MKECISREAALAALKTYNKEPFHILHGGGRYALVRQ